MLTQIKASLLIQLIALQNTVPTAASVNLPGGNLSVRSESQGGHRPGGVWERTAAVVVLSRGAWQNESRQTESPKSRTEDLWSPSLGGGVYSAPAALWLISAMTGSQTCQVRLTLGSISVHHCSSSRHFSHCSTPSGTETTHNDFHTQPQNNRKAVCISVLPVWLLRGVHPDNLNIAQRGTELFSNKLLKQCTLIRLLEVCKCWC